MALAEAGFVNLDMGRHHQLASSLSPTEMLIHEIGQMGIQISDISERPVADLILKSQGRITPFPETDQTREIRMRMACLNEVLADAPIWFNAPWARILTPGTPLESIHDDRRRLHRVFHDEWTKHGRLYGGWWINLPKSLRSYIQIGNESVAYIDWASMHVRLAYGMMKMMPPPGDLYDLSGYLTGYQWKQRSAVKQIMNANFNRSQTDMRFPGETRKAFPGMKYADIHDAICRKHPALVDFMKTRGKTFGQELVYQESEILIKTLQTMNASEIVALPLHDGLFVLRSKQWAARRIMADVTREIVGFAIPVETLDMYVRYTLDGDMIQRELRTVLNGKLKGNETSLWINSNSLTAGCEKTYNTDTYTEIHSVSI